MLSTIYGFFFFFFEWWFILNVAVILCIILFIFIVLSGKVVIEILVETSCEAFASPSGLCFSCLSRLGFSLFSLPWCIPIWFFTLQWNISAIKLSSIRWRRRLPLWLRQPSPCRKPLWGSASVWPVSLFKWIYVGSRCFFFLPCCCSWKVCKLIKKWKKVVLCWWCPFCLASIFISSWETIILSFPHYQWESLAFLG